MNTVEHCDGSLPLAIFAKGSIIDDGKYPKYTSEFSLHVPKKLQFGNLYRKLLLSDRTISEDKNYHNLKS